MIKNKLSFLAGIIFIVIGLIYIYHGTIIIGLLDFGAGVAMYFLGGVK